MAKNKRDIGKIMTKIVAGLLAILMIGSVATTLIYYIISMAN